MSVTAITPPPPSSEFVESGATTSLPCAVEDGDEHISCTASTLREAFRTHLGPQEHDGASPLHEAAEDGNETVITALIAMGADVEEVDEEGQTPLMAAASFGQAGAIRLLVKSGHARVNRGDGVGDTALHEASRAGEIDAVLALLDCDADVHVRNKLGCTPLHIASHAGHGDIVRALVQAGAAVNGPDGEMNGGYSALHIAAANGSTQSLTALLEAGANIRASASESDLLRRESTALDIADANGHDGVATILRNASTQDFNRNGLFSD